MKIIRNSGRSFPVIEMTFSEYQALPDWSVSYPKNRSVGDIGKIPELCFPGERLIEMVEETHMQIMHCVIKEN